MKVSVGVLAICLALCHASHPGYKDGKKYIYDYTAKYGSGVSDDAVTQFAGRGWKGQLHVYHVNNHLAVEFHDVKTGEFNRRLKNVFDVVDINYQAPTTPEETAAVAVFAKPYYGEYGSDGKIVASKHTSHLDNAFTNVQRSVLALFQIVFPSDHAHDHYYTVDESGIGGDCNTSYVINHHPDDYHPDEEVLNITKNYRYDECTYRPHSLFSSLIGYECQHCKQDSFSPFRNVARIDYNIKGNRAAYTIEHIYGSSYVGFTPFTTNGQTAMSITNQTLHLVKVEDYTPEAVPSDAERIEGLYFRFNMENIDFDNVDLKENHVLDRVYPHKYVENRYADRFGGEKDHVAQATSLLPKITPAKFADYHEIAQVTDLLGHVLFTFSYADFEKFFDQNIKLGSDATPEEKDRRNYVLKMLTIVGTDPSILYALDQIRTKQIPEKVEAEMLSVLPLYAKFPTKPLVEEYRKFVNSEYVNADHNKILFSVAWQAYGTLIFRACVKDEYNNHPQRKQTFIDREHCKEYVKEIIDHFHKAERSEDKCVYVRALKNTQTEEAYHVLIDEIIPGHKYNEYIRATAIWGLEHYVFDEEHETKVNEVMLPIFTDHNEDYQLRIYAFDVLLYINHHARFYSNLLVTINEEPNLQVASYVWSTLSSLANTTDPCYEEVSQHAKHILPYILRKDYDFDFLRHSTNKLFAFYNEQYGYGRSSQLTVIGGNNTAVPREVYFRQSFNIAGRTYDFVEMGFIQRDNHGLDSVLAAVLEQYNLMYAPKMGGEDYGLAKHVDAEKFIAKMSSEIYSRIFDQDIAVVHSLDFPKHSAYFTKLSDNTAAIHYTKVVSAAQVEYVIPNMVGLPVYLHLFSPAVVKLSGTVGYHADKKSLTELPKVTLTPDLKYVMDFENQASILVDNPIVGASGYQLRTDGGIKFPIHGEIELDLAHDQIHTKEIVSDEAYDMIYYDTQPYTFTRNSHLVAVKYSEKPVQKQYKFGHNYFGAGLKFQFSYDYYWNDYGSYRSFFKTFFHKSTRYEDYYDLADKWYAGSRGFLDYAVLNPTARPFHFRARFERSTTNPTTEVHSHFQRTESDYYNKEKKDDKQAWTTKNCKLAITAKGPVERKWKVELEVDRHWPVTDYRHLTFHYQRSAIPNYDDKPYEVCYESKAHVYGRSSIIANPLHPEKEAKIDYAGILKVGQDCEGSAKRITVKAHLTKSEEQKHIDHEKLYIYQKCKEDYAKGYEYSYACWQVKKDQGRLDHLDLEIEYDANVNPKVKEFFYRIYLWFRHSFYNNLQIDRDVETTVSDNHIRVEANLSYYQPILDVHISRPHEKVHYHKIFVPSVIPRYEPVTVVEPVWSRYWRRGARLQRPMCFFSGDYVYTLDGAKYKYPLGDCYHVAVANCLRENVLLLFKAVKDGKYSKALKLVVDNHYVEIKPEGGKLVAYADGSAILQNGEHAHIKEEEDRYIYAVYHKYTGYVVESKVSGLKVYFDGKNAKIKVSNLYHGVQCGMCGDFNNERHHEFRGVDGTLYHTPTDFAHSYAIQKDGCHA